MTDPVPHDPGPLDAVETGADIELPRARTRVRQDRKSVLALALFLFASVLVVIAFIVGFNLYENTNLSSGVSLGIIILPCMVLWVVALCFGILVPISGANRVLCAVLQEATGAAHVIPLTESTSIDDLIPTTTSSVGKTSIISPKMLLAVDTETLSFWTAQHHTLHRTIALPISSLLTASAQSDPGSGSPLAMKICLTLRLPTGATAEVQFSPRPTTMHLLTEPESVAATLRSVIERRAAANPA